MTEQENNRECRPEKKGIFISGEVLEDIKKQMGTRPKEFIENIIKSATSDQVKDFLLANYIEFMFAREIEICEEIKKIIQDKYPEINLAEIDSIIAKHKDDAGSGAAEEELKRAYFILSEKKDSSTRSSGGSGYMDPSIEGNLSQIDANNERARQDMENYFKGLELLGLNYVFIDIDGQETSDDQEGLFASKEGTMLKSEWTENKKPSLESKDGGNIIIDKAVSNKNIAKLAVTQDLLGKEMQKNVDSGERGDIKVKFAEDTVYNPVSGNNVLMEKVLGYNAGQCADVFMEKKLSPELSKLVNKKNLFIKAEEAEQNKNGKIKNSDIDNGEGDDL